MPCRQGITWLGTAVVDVVCSSWRRLRRSEKTVNSFPGAVTEASNDQHGLIKAG